jgi:hypothetical protein
MIGHKTPMQPPNLYIAPQVQSLRDLHRDVVNGEYYGRSIYDVLAVQAEAILNAHAQCIAAVTFHLACWCPDFIGQSADSIMAGSLNEQQAQLTIAKEHGFADWDEVTQLKNVPLQSDFERAVDAVVAGNIQQLSELLNTNPELSNQASQYGHGARLLHYVGANGVESYRQITPLNAADVAQALINAGAEVNAMANMYGGTTALGLVVSSAHPHHAGVVEAISAVLKQAGAIE